MVILGSDAHISYDVAKYDLVFKLLEEDSFPDALVINDKPDLFREILKRNRARVSLK
jgi:putative hydrolase